MLHWVHFRCVLVRGESTERVRQSRPLAQGTIVGRPDRVTDARATGATDVRATGATDARATGVTDVRAVSSTMDTMLGRNVFATSVP